MTLAQVASRKSQVASRGLPFTWRKKWEAVWDEVKYCSDRCRRDRKPDALPPAANANPPAAVTGAPKPGRAA